MRAVVAVFLFLAAPPAARAEPQAGTYALVEGRSSVRVDVASPLGPVRVTLPAHGELRFAGNGEIAGGHLVLDAAALRADALAGRQLRGPEGFDVARHPRATVAIDGGDVDGASVALEGRLTLRATTRPVRLTGEVVRERGTRFTAELSGTIDRTAFGIVAGRPLYSRHAQVRLRIVAGRTGR